MGGWSAACFYVSVSRETGERCRLGREGYVEGGD